MIESFQYANDVKTVFNNTDSPDAQTMLILKRKFAMGELTEEE